MKQEELMILSMLNKAEVASPMFSTATGVYANQNSLVRRFIEDLHAIIPPPEERAAARKKAKKEKEVSDKGNNR